MDREQAKRFMVLWLSKRDQERNKKELEWKTLIWQQLERRRRVSVAVIFFSKRLERRYWMNKLQQQGVDNFDLTRTDNLGLQYFEDFELLNSHGFELWNSHDFELLSVDYALFGQCIPQNLKAGVRTHTSF